MRTLKLIWKLWVRPLFCKHDYQFVRNIFGDEIHWHGWKRSVWRCSKCGKVRYENWCVLKINDEQE